MRRRYTSIAVLTLVITLLIVLILGGIVINTQTIDEESEYKNTLEDQAKEVDIIEDEKDDRSYIEDNGDTTTYENTVKYNDEYDLYVSVKIENESLKLIEIIDFSMQQDGARAQSIFSTPEDIALHDVGNYMFRNPSNKFPSEEQIKSKINIDALNYDIVKQCWEGLGLPENLQKSTKVQQKGVLLYEDEKSEILASVQGSWRIASLDYIGNFLYTQTGHIELSSDQVSNFNELNNYIINNYITLEIDDTDIIVNGSKYGNIDLTEFTYTEDFPILLYEDVWAYSLKDQFYYDTLNIPIVNVDVENATGPVGLNFWISQDKVWVEGTISRVDYPHDWSDWEYMFELQRI